MTSSDAWVGGFSTHEHAFIRTYFLNLHIYMQTCSQIREHSFLLHIKLSDRHLHITYSTCPGPLVPSADRFADTHTSERTPLQQQTEFHLLSFFVFSMKTPECNISLTSFYLPIFWLETLAMQVAGYTRYAYFLNDAACIYTSQQR